MATKNVRVPFQMGQISNQAKRGWTVRVNGEEIEGVESLEIESPKFGTVRYGQHPAGYDTWVFDELGGGGAVTIPYMIHPINGMLYVGVVEQNRPLLGRRIWEVPRGFMDPSDKDKAATALREALEELGYEFSQPIKLADGKNPNSTFFDTSGEDEGVAFFGLSVTASALIETKDSYAFPAIVQEAAKGDGCERIYGSKFIPVSRILYSPDLFSAAAGFYLLQYLQKKTAAAVLYGEDL
ncbi:MAG: NUDIX domain-containing protein [Candidatus Nomurabacteria bacterium]|jgi:8-oxo-dGTP pyrophosphatase MutT (NUDIX family)|nr:NUDIX domain-containing protein [Candidatus Nomurabacteria bacterium]